MPSNFCLLAKSHAPTQECVQIAVGDVSVAATLQMPWHARAVVILLDTGDAGIEHINTMAAHQLELAKIGVITLGLEAPAAALDRAFAERCLGGAMQWLGNYDATCALPIGSLWVDSDLHVTRSRRRRFIRTTLFHNRRVNLANQAEIYRDGISRFLIGHGTPGVADGGDGGQGGSVCERCAENAPAGTMDLSESAAVAQLAMQIGFWFSDHLNCISDQLDRSICPARVTRFARKCWAISDAHDVPGDTALDAPRKFVLQAL
jgi:hypothetical protein